ncbi:unnamed protein product [Oncorhynchus mykiss]|uniref:LIM zinc-binding domain-containing protein n=1 Tax=Oncorhynchus mykiss TaxID=8022 RepID=A0A060XPZ3_ONCMY|nr:unnamed protein product [Oncorhynchus mykiss]
MKNYKGFEKRPYCNAHYPKTNFTCVADTPENLRLKQQSKMQSQVQYKEEFEKNKGKGFSAVADTPEMQRIKKTQDHISNVVSNGTLVKVVHYRDQGTIWDSGLSLSLTCSAGSFDRSRSLIYKYTTLAKSMWTSAH